MRRLLLVAAVLSLFGIALSAEDTTKNDIQELRDKMESLTKLVQTALINSQAKGNLEDRNTLDTSSRQNETNLEERVQALEFQMENVHEDITVIEGEITVINSEQDLQDTQI